MEITYHFLCGFKVFATEYSCLCCPLNMTKERSTYYYYFANSIKVPSKWGSQFWGVAQWQSADLNRHLYTHRSVQLLVLIGEKMVAIEAHNWSKCRKKCVSKVFSYK